MYKSLYYESVRSLAHPTPWLRLLHLPLWSSSSSRQLAGKLRLTNQTFHTTSIRPLLYTNPFPRVTEVGNRTRLSPRACLHLFRDTTKRL